ncbi:protein of unknown function [Mesotoga infera]|uniref:Uncharacterized protein n=1 Tax=Mesotoga infera TaxID=1236046 RepID=A0A7Z7LEW0_9BACT|nr:protein of unknown function [Mesotoga infera]
MSCCRDGFESTKEGYKHNMRDYPNIILYCVSNQPKRDINLHEAVHAMCDTFQFRINQRGI